MQEAQLIQRAMLGDEIALSELIEFYYMSIYAFCCRQMGNTATGADICQDTFLKMVEALPRYKENGKFKSWLFTIASNSCRDAFRRARPTSELDDTIPDRYGGFEEKTENAALLKGALHKLKHEQREIVILHYYHDLKIKDIAQILHLPMTTVKTRLFRSVKKLQELLREEIILEQ